MIDKLEAQLSYYRAREVKQGQAERHYNKALKYIDEMIQFLDLKSSKTCKRRK